MTFFIPDDKPPRRANPAPAPLAGFADVLGAAWTSETIETDAWMRFAREERAILDDLSAALGPETEQDRNLLEPMPGHRMTTHAANRLRRQRLFDRLGIRAAEDPGRWAEYPHSQDAVRERANRQLRAEWDDASNTLQMGGWGAGVTEFIGRGAAAATDPIGLALLPLGGVGGSLLKVVAAEAALGAIGEAATLPRQFEAAERLDIPAPNAAAQIAVGALFGGVLGGGATALARGARYAQTRGEWLREAPDSLSLPERAGEVARVQAALEGVDLPPNQTMAPRDVPAPASRRGFTMPDQVVAPSGMRVAVQYEVVDIDSLSAASGDLQPRDRSRVSSDDQIASMAAELDPGRLMPAPEADRGAPIVGPDSIVESGNGRVAAIRQAADRVPDRYEAYVTAIRSVMDIPEGIARPVLVARRTSDLTLAERQNFVRGANSSAIARMSATEQAAVDGASLTDAVLEEIRPDRGLQTSQNASAARAWLEAMPANERAGLVDGQGRLNIEGQNRLRNALFARAYGDRQLIEIVAERGSEEMRGLLDALVDVAPDLARLRAEIAAGRVHPTVDPQQELLGAIRLIVEARREAARDKTPLATVLREKLDNGDLITGGVDTVTAELVELMMPGGRVARPEVVRDVLRAYVSEARTAADTAPRLFDDGMSVGPREILDAAKREIDRFSDQGPAAGPRPDAGRQTQPRTEPDRTRPEAGGDGAGGAGRAQPGFKLDPDKPKFIDTRAQGRRFHGSGRSDIPEIIDDFLRTDLNYYGSGFYTTDAAAIADGYSRSRKSADATIYEATEISGVVAFDLEQPVPDWLVADEPSDLVQSALESIAEDIDTGLPSVRDLYDEMRSLSREFGYSAGDVQDIFDSLRYRMEDRGFNAIDHLGGQLTGKSAHQVRIYFEPSRQLSLEKAVSETIEAPKPAPPRPAVSFAPPASWIPPVSDAPQNKAPVTMRLDELDEIEADLDALGDAADIEGEDGLTLRQMLDETRAELDFADQLQTICGLQGRAQR